MSPRRRERGLGRGVAVVARGGETTAQGAMPSHPIVDGWRFANDLGDGITFPSLAHFHADGTYIEDFPDAGSFSMGVREPTGERSVAVTVYQVYVVDDRLVNGEGRFTAEVDETENALTSTGAFVGTFEDGSINFAAEGPAPATRLEVLPDVPLPDLVPGGTPVLPPDLSGEATPTP